MSAVFPCTGATRIALAAVACAVMLSTNLVWIQVGVIAAAAVAGRLLIKPVAAAVSASDGVPFSRTFAKVSAALLVLALFVLPK